MMSAPENNRVKKIYIKTMDCKIKYNSIVEFVRMLGVAMVVFFIVYKLTPIFQPFIDRYQNFIIVVDILVLMVAFFVMFGSRFFNWKGHLVFILGVGVLCGVLFLTLFILESGFGLRDRADVFSVVYHLVYISVVIVVCNSYRCFVKWKLLTNQKLLKTFFRESSI